MWRFFFFLNKSFHVRHFKISARLTPQVTTIIYHHMKKVILNKIKKKRKKKQKYGGLDQNPYVNKNVEKKFLHRFFSNFSLY